MRALATREKRREYFKSYFQKNKDILRLKNAVRYAHGEGLERLGPNGDVIRAKDRAYYFANKDEINKKRRERRARKKERKLKEKAA